MSKFNEIRGEIVKNITTNWSPEKKNNVYSSLNRGQAILETKEQLDQYIFSFGKMHYAKLIAVFEAIHDLKNINDKNIQIIDYGCGQGIGTVVLLDHLKSLKQSLSITDIKLIEPSNIALNQAKEYVSKHFEAPIVFTTKINDKNTYIGTFIPSDRAIFSKFNHETWQIFLTELIKNKILTHNANKKIKGQTELISIKTGKVAGIIVDTNEHTLNTISSFSAKIKINDTGINLVNKKIDQINHEDLSTHPEVTKFHIFSNILDVNDFCINSLSEKIKNTQSGENYFICVSPDYWSGNQRLDNFMNLFMNQNCSVISERKGTIENPNNPNKPWKFYEKAFKLQM